ncbi:FAD-dependent monooxygenase, partial [Micromonospora sp. WMMD737]|uniref:FAD-dependent monooxygenase n=1 Tax=Micromonospora sp. WMMD737 TaxID=3404113 RepID=UPI003B961583
MAKHRDILIVGATVEGICSAIALDATGRSVELVEAEPPPMLTGALPVDGVGPAGPGVALVGNAIRALDTLGLARACISRGAAIETTCMHRLDGTLLKTVPARPEAGPGLPPMLGILRDDLVGVLLAAAIERGISVTASRAVAAIEQRADWVAVTFSDGSSAEYDGVVAADGIRSVMRPMLFGDLGKPEATGQSSWRYTLPRLDDLEGSHLYFSPDGSKVGLVPLRNDLMDLFLNVNQAEPVATTPLDEQLREHLAPFGDLIAEVRDDIRGADRVNWRPYEVVNLPSPWFDRRVIVIGDAAHATTSHLKQSEALAIEDAVVLGEELASNDEIPDAFQAF